MIPRTLVPLSLSPRAPDSASKAPRRRWTLLDSRTLVPQDLPVAPLEIETSIPAHVPLEVLAERILVPRDMPLTPLQTQSEIPSHLPLTVLDTRVAVPKDAHPASLEIKAPAAREELPGLLDPDVLTTGQVHLLPKPVESGAPRWGWPPTVSSILFHALLIVFVFLQPKFFPYRPPTQEEIEMAHRSLGLVYLPPPPVGAPKVVPNPPPPSANIHIDPEFFRQIAPPEVEASPTPGGAAERAAPRDLPAAPAPQLSEQRGDAAQKMARLETPKSPPTPSGLLLAPSSPGRLLEDSRRRAAERGGTSGAEFGGPVRPGPGGAVGPGQGYLGGTVQILTPTEGVDFTNYIARMLASVRRNWYAVIPETARLGEKGIVVLDFSVLKDGNVPPGDPQLMRSSAREPLDRAAISAIRASNPFEPLPPEFGGPLVKFRFMFLYNIRLEQQ